MTEVGLELEESFVVFGAKKDRLVIGVRKEEIRVYTLPEFKRLHSFKSDYRNENGGPLTYTAIIAGTYQARDCSRVKPNSHWGGGGTLTR